MLHSVMPMAKLLFKHPTDQTLKKITELCVAQSLFFFQAVDPVRARAATVVMGTVAPLKRRVAPRHSKAGSRGRTRALCDVTARPSSRSSRAAGDQ